MPEHTPGPTPVRGVYGLAMYITFQLLFIFFILWATIPEKWFNNMGITYLPQRYWAVAIPVFALTVIAVFAFVIYPSLGLLMTPDMDSIETITDPASKYTAPPENDYETSESKRRVPCICKGQTFCMKHMYDTMDVIVRNRNAIPGIQDLRIEDVSEDLYL